ncbi:hypothetical protein [Streptomyces sp. XY431]|uniref:hypothetical protein n=1 Tax=Streptomyces sp. XY431 TaxID=1415562 RepID=UPI0006AED722|nr:hypothetical protein [Streptomyces sp. XY431]
MATARGREGARIISALETMWSTIQARHPGVPDAVVITGAALPAKPTKAKRAAYQHWGHLTPDRWRAEDGKVPELFVAAELLERGGQAVLEALLHSAAHGLAATRGIVDRSSDGLRWHNKKFAALAVEVGLQPPERAAQTIGFSDAPIKDATAASYRAAIRRLEEARLPVVPGDGDQAEDQAEGEGEEESDEPKKIKSGGKRYAVVCKCLPEPRRLQVTPKAYGKGDRQGGIACKWCGSEFQPETDEAAEAFDAYDDDPLPVAEETPTEAPADVAAAGSEWAGEEPDGEEPMPEDQP